MDDFDLMMISLKYKDNEEIMELIDEIRLLNVELLDAYDASWRLYDELEEAKEN